MFKGVSLWAGVFSGGMAQLQDTQAMASGKMDKKEYAIQTSKNLTGSLGIMAGFEYGAILGSAIIPGAGTIIGSIIGSIIGNRIGNYAGYQAGNILFNNQMLNNSRLLQNVRPTLSEN
ncbi:hypothetical protein C0971_12485 [Bacillus methanolicus]|uniref:glycine zipper domain-containing protein n=1 Tax=Bacillus methanolicus TaxID=1471 RepID=UPI00200D549C|nr:hypothetical protein [Bacillus methanolicus]UQD52759.1 hypothetical protein C0971_12485 [Bacillus methanolicus]